MPPITVATSMFEVFEQNRCSGISNIVGYPGGMASRTATRRGLPEPKSEAGQALPRLAAVEE
ncbi:hypothetical protein FAF44_08400 [Nonomuraea sp. MG754425]|uniref:hypothetical protein n=1 Tax=Nonomuraea sp. MG754425 TaxID=2570319 RepID=UPI001F2286AE|nr:hypothetical protein [Nonomuraea sp. MG754425]MCF6468414.1 hypothetical protein [Nonomuraea sp. MG754425]